MFDHHAFSPFAPAPSSCMIRARDARAQVPRRRTSHEGTLAQDSADGRIRLLASLTRTEISVLPETFLLRSLIRPSLLLEPGATEGRQIGQRGAAPLWEALPHPAVASCRWASQTPHPYRIIKHQSGLTTGNPLTLRGRFESVRAEFTIGYAPGGSR